MRAFLLCFVVLVAMVFTTTEAITSRKHLLKSQDDVDTNHYCWEESICAELSDGWDCNPVQYCK